MGLVSIGGRKVPVLIGAGLTEIYFSAGAHGKKERGSYRFWTAIGEDKYGPYAIIGRALRKFDAGDRFARMSWERTKKNPLPDRRVYLRMFKMIQPTLHYIRPATERDVSRWASSHKKDWPFASKVCLIRGKRYRKFPRVP